MLAWNDHATHHCQIRNHREYRQHVGDGVEKRQAKIALPDASITEQLEAQGFILLPILPRHIEAARKLRCEHADPFDRLLLAQTQDERLTLLTRDVAILGLELEGVAKG